MLATRARRICPSRTTSQAARAGLPAQPKPPPQRRSKSPRGVLRGDQEPARVHDIGQRARRQGQEKERQRPGDLNSGDESRARIEAGHQPGRAGVVHCQSNVRKRRRDENDHKSTIAEQARGQLSARWRRRVDVQFGSHVIRPVSGRCPASGIWVPPFSGFGKRERADTRRAYRCSLRNAPACASARRPGSSRAFQSGHAWIMCGQTSRVAETSAPPAAAVKRTASSSKVSVEPT